MPASPIIDAFIDLLYPPECVLTGALPDSRGFRYLSKEGLESLHIIKPPHCHTCGFPFFGIVRGSRDCPHCKALEPAYKDGRTLLLLNDAGRKLIHTLKYHNGKYLIPDIVELAEKAPEYLKFLQHATLVPVPLSARKQRERGYNQSMLIAAAFARRVNTKVEKLLIRTKDTPSQTSLRRKEREKNVRNAFNLVSSKALKASTRYIIIDDVFTTGATLNACARALISGGAKNVDIATLGHG